MNTTIKRFLALNCILHGHSLLDAFDGNREQAAASITDGNEKLLQYYLDQLAFLQSSPSALNSEDPVALAFVNFFRSSEYASVCLGGLQPISISMFAVSDRRGEVDDQVRNAVVLNALKDVTFTEKPKRTSITDGLLYTTVDKKDRIRKLMLRGYALYSAGPFNNGMPCEAMIASVNKFTLEGYTNISAKGVEDILKALIDFGVPPTDFTRTLLNIPDLLPVYQKTGAVMELLPDGTGVQWLMDLKGTAKGKVVTVGRSNVRSLLISSLSDLANISYEPGAKSNGLVV